MQLETKFKNGYMALEPTSETGFGHFSFTSPSGSSESSLRRTKPYTCRLFKLKICYWTVTLRAIKSLKQYKNSEYHSLPEVRNQFSENFIVVVVKQILEQPRFYGLRKFGSHMYNYRERKKLYRTYRSFSQKEKYNNSLQCGLGHFWPTTLLFVSTVDFLFSSFDLLNHRYWVS